jgi:S1-C subfamily serine protease
MTTVIVVVVAGAAGLVVGCSSSGTAKKVNTTAAASAAGDPVQALYEQVVRTVLPSVVQIVTDQGEGSGVVYDGKGDIVTNAHVVAGAKTLEVTPASGGNALKGTLVGAFAADDLAVIKVEGSKLPPANFGDSSRLQVGQIVMAMGNPLGLNGSVTQGIVSALGRTVTTKREGSFPGATIADSIQTSAAINPGNSGGALVTLRGEVIGIPSSSAGDPQLGGAAVGIGFAIPSATVKSIAPQLIQNGKVNNSGRAALGITVRTTVDLNTGQPNGVGVVAVNAGGAADKAGIKAGDVIVSVNGTKTPTQSALAETLANLKPGDSAKLAVQMPDGTTKTVSVTLGQLPGG